MAKVEPLQAGFNMLSRTVVPLKEAFGEKLKYDENKTELLYQGFITR